MIKHNVISSNISKIGYDEELKILEVDFVRGTSYQYVDVPKKLYLELMGSESKGKFLIANIKPNYSYAKLN